MKTQRVRVPSEDTTASDLHENEPDPCGGQSTDNNSLNALCSLNASEDNGAGECIDARPAEKAHRKSFSLQSSEDAPLDESVASADSVVQPSELEDKTSFAAEQGSLTPQFPTLDHNHLSSAGLFLLSHMQITKSMSRIIYTCCRSLDSGAAKEPPKPKPRLRTLAMSLQAAEKTNDDAESLELSQAQTSSVSIPLSTDASSDAAVRISITQCHYASLLLRHCIVKVNVAIYVCNWPICLVSL